MALTFEEGEQDQGLKGQFAKPENLSGIFNWCLEGYKKFCQRGLELPQAVTKATEDYKDDSDRIGQFIEAWLEKEEGSELRTAAAYQLYTKWCEENGYSSENQKNFKNAIGVHFKVVRKRPKGGGGQTTLIMDCRFKEVEDGAEDLTVQYRMHISQRTVFCDLFFSDFGCFVACSWFVAEIS